MTQYHRQLEDELIAVPPRQRALTAAGQSAGLIFAICAHRALELAKGGEST
jgi:hypothetical protein